MIYEFDDKYEVTVAADVDGDNKAEYVENKFQSLFIDTTIRLKGEEVPRMTQRYKKSPMTEGFERKYPDFIDRMDKQKEYAEIIKYVEDNIIVKIFNILYDKEKESRKLAKEIEAEMFKDAFGNLI